MSTDGNSRRRIVAITRPYGHITRTAALIRRYGWQPLVIPTLRIRATPKAAQRSLTALPPRIDYAIFLSQNAPRALARIRSPLFPLLRIATLVAIGPRTADAVARTLHREPLLPPTYTSDGIARLLADHALQGRTILLVRARGAPRDLDLQLQARGARVIRVEAYEASASVPASARRRLREALQSDELYALLCTSRRATEALFRAMPDLPKLAANAKVIGLGPATAHALQEYYIRAALQPPAASLEATLAWLSTFRDAEHH